MWFDLVLIFVAASPLTVHEAGSMRRQPRAVNSDSELKREGMHYFDGVGPASSASSPASSITGTFSSRALSSLEPASSPATT